MVSDDPFTCAALIGAASSLVASGKVAADQDLGARGLLVATGQVNAYAIPRNLSEAEAYRQVNAEKARLLSTLPADQIMSRARACLASAR